ncbi:unnamed protein product [Sphenostylis stenocarpa]|uniref:UDP-glycosyltransferase n=1 Tax=Sphenostylis stenocarpa TaxID=92480 RepID=A0AA86S9Y7_9FABA|nr:unnamed protein product [Sphenostylis stenocarpa]
MVVDAFAYEALDLAQEFNMLSYFYFPSSATTLSTDFYLPKLDQETSCEYRDLPHPIQVPGCVRFYGRDLGSVVQDRKSEDYKMVLEICKRYLCAEGIIVNSFLALETGPLRALRDEGRAYPPAYAVGPLVKTGTDSAQEQINELACGLELSNHKFLWVVRAPNNADNSVYLSEQKWVDPVQFLPSGFLERTKEQGVFIPSWAPQIEVLRHSSVGGFLTHCGWNSTLESVVHGVPLITWPLFAEQRMNAVVLCEGLKVGVRPRVSENGLVEREEIVEVIKYLMEGEEGRQMGKRMKELAVSATNALKEDGSSTKTLSELAQLWTNLA